MSASQFTDGTVEYKLLLGIEQRRQITEGAAGHNHGFALAHKLQIPVILPAHVSFHEKGMAETVESQRFPVFPAPPDIVRENEKGTLVRTQADKFVNETAVLFQGKRPAKGYEVPTPDMDGYGIGI